VIVRLVANGKRCHLFRVILFIYRNIFIYVYNLTLKVEYLILSNYVMLLDSPKMDKYNEHFAMMDSGLYDMSLDFEGLLRLSLIPVWE